MKNGNRKTKKQGKGRGLNRLRSLRDEMWQAGGRWRGNREEWRLGRSNIDSTRRSAEENVGSTEWELRSRSERESGR